MFFTSTWLECQLRIFTAWQFGCAKDYFEHFGVNGKHAFWMQPVRCWQWHAVTLIWQRSLEMPHFAITSLSLLKLKRATLLLKILGFGGLLFSVFNQLCNVQCVWFSFYILFIVFTLFYAQHLLIRTQLLLSPYWMDYGTSLTMSWEKPRCAWCLRPWVPTFWPSSRGTNTYARWDGLVFPTCRSFEIEPLQVQL